MAVAGRLVSLVPVLGVGAVVVLYVRVRAVQSCSARAVFRRYAGSAPAELRARPAVKGREPRPRLVTRGRGRMKRLAPYGPRRVRRRRTRGKRRAVGTRSWRVVRSRGEVGVTAGSRVQRARAEWCGPGGGSSTFKAAERDHRPQWRPARRTSAVQPRGAPSRTSTRRRPRPSHVRDWMRAAVPSPTLTYMHERVSRALGRDW